MNDIDKCIDRLSHLIVANGDNERLNNRHTLYAAILLVRYGFVTQEKVTNSTLMNFVPEKYKLNDDGELTTLSSEGVRLIIEANENVLVKSFNYLFSISIRKIEELSDLCSTIKEKEIVPLSIFVEKINKLNIFPRGVSVDFIDLLKKTKRNNCASIHVANYQLQRTSNIVGDSVVGRRNTVESVDLIFYKKDPKKLSKLKSIIRLTETDVKNSSVVNLDILTHSLSKKIGFEISRELLFYILSSRSDFVNLTQNMNLNRLGCDFIFSLSGVKNQFFLRDLTTLLHYRKSIDVEDSLYLFTKAWLKNETNRLLPLFDSSRTSGFNEKKGLRDYEHFDTDNYCTVCLSALIMVATNNKNFTLNERDNNGGISLFNITISDLNELTPITNDNYNVFFNLSEKDKNYDGTVKALLQHKRHKFDKAITTNLFYTLSNDGLSLSVDESNIDFYNRSLGTHILPDYEIKLQEDMDISVKIAEIKQKQRYVFDNFWFKPDKSLPVEERHDLFTISKRLNIKNKAEFFKNKQCVEDLLATIVLIPLSEARIFLNQELSTCNIMIENRQSKLDAMDRSTSKKDDSMNIQNRHVINKELSVIFERVNICKKLLIDIEKSDNALEISRLVSERKSIASHIYNDLSTTGKFREERFIHQWIVSNGGKLDLDNLSIYINEQLLIDKKSIMSFTSKFLLKNPLAVKIH